MKTLLSHPRFFILAAVAIALRLVLMIQFPVVADEAYYFYWGTHPAGGYYDLPPMVGWWETIFTSFSLSSLWLRLPNLLTMIFVAFGVREWTRPAIGDKSATFLGLIFFFLPVPYLAVLIAPDLPLLFFTFYSSVLFFSAQRKRDYLLSGALWGAAFLSKYFAVFSLPALLVWYFYSQRKSGRKIKFQGILFFALGGLPFVLQHVLWNGMHCWANFVFNLIVRQQYSDGAWSEVMGLFVLYIALMSTPFLWKNLIKPGKKRTERRDTRKLETYFLLSWGVPMAFFTLTALIGKGQGLHWYVPYLPFFVMWVGLRIADESSIRRRAYGVLGVALVMGASAVGALHNPDHWIKPALRDRHAFEFELAFRPDDIFERLYPSLNGMDAVALDGYSLASVFDLEFKRRLGKDAPPLLVAGKGTRFGRVFDFTSPWKKLDGKNILFIARGEWSPHDWARFFETTETRWVEINGIRFWLSKGIGFRYSLYQDEVLRRGTEEFYPPFLGLPCACELRDSK